MKWIDRLIGIPRLHIDDASDIAFSIAAWIAREEISSKVIVHNAENILEWGLRDYTRYKVLADESRRILQQATTWASEYSEGLRKLAQIQRNQEAERERRVRWTELGRTREEYRDRTGSWPADESEFMRLDAEFGSLIDEPMINYGSRGPFWVAFPKDVKSDRKILELTHWEGV